MKHIRFFSVYGLLLLILLAAIQGCGKKGLPVPNDNRNLFTWTGSSMMILPNSCLTVSATLSGNIANLTDVVLELQPLLPDNTCAGCPFTPTERAEFAESAVRGHPAVNTVRLTYCPQAQTPSYHWRLVGINVHKRFPYALTPVQAFVVQEYPEIEHAPFYLP